MKRQAKRPTSSHGSAEPADKPCAFPDEENLTARSMEHEETEMDYDVDDDEERAAQSSSSCGGLGEKKRRLALDQVRALERSFETDNKLDPDRKARIARDLGLQPRQVAVWFQNRRARWKTKQIERDFAALRARHDALRADCDALRRDRDALADEIRELRQKLSKPETAAVKVETAGGNDAAVGGASAAAVYKDHGSSDSDSSVVFNNDVVASPYSGGGAVLEKAPAGFLLGFGVGSLVDSSAATTMSSLPCSFGTNKWQQHGPTTTFPCDPSYKGGGYGFTEEWLAGSDAGISSDAFFPDEHASSLNFSSWCANGADGWD